MREGFTQIHDTLNRHKDGQFSVKDFDDERGVKPNIDVDFDSLIDERNELRGREKPLNKKEVEELLWQMANEEIKEFYENLLDKIGQETNYFHDWEELGIQQILTAGLEDNFIVNSFIIWDSERIKRERKKPKGGRASFVYPGIGKILIGQKRPDREDMIEQLSQDGELPGGAMVLFHELIHNVAQSPFRKDKYIKLEDLISLLPKILVGQRRIKELGEAQAYLAGNMYGSKKEEEKKRGNTGLITRIEGAQDKKGTDLYKNFSRDKLIYGFQSVQRLSALGLTPIEIGRLVQSPGKWDEATATYLKFEKVIKQKSEELGLDEYDLDTLVDADRLEREINQLRAMRIVQEELAKVKNQKQN